MQGNKKCAKEQKIFLLVKMKLSSVAHYGIELSYLPFEALCDVVWPCVVFLWSVVAFHRHNMAGIV